MPRGLFGRSLIIIVAPMVLLQGVITYVFFERDLDTTTRRLARDVAADVAFLATLEDSTPSLERDGLRALSARELRYRLTFHDGEQLAPPTQPPASTIDKALDDILASSMGPRRHFQTGRIGNDFDIKVNVKDGVLEILVPRDRVTVSQPDIFILWMVGSALILLAVAILFLRNQVRPIERLARASEMFGKGRPVPDFKPYGATEVRRAAQAFITMRERIERHVTQRTEMLAGVSHDLKTPLTRMKLALAMMPDDAEIRSPSSPTSPRWSICWTIISPSRAAKVARNLRKATWANWCATPRWPPRRARAADEDRLTVRGPDHMTLSIKTRGAAPLPHQSGGQCA